MHAKLSFDEASEEKLADVIQQALHYSHCILLLAVKNWSELHSRPLTTPASNRRMIQCLVVLEGVVARLASNSRGSMLIETLETVSSLALVRSVARVPQ